MKTNRTKLIEMTLKVAFFGVCFTLFAWVFASWADVVLHNTLPNPVYQPWNLFTLLFC